MKLYNLILLFSFISLTICAEDLSGDKKVAAVIKNKAPASSQTRSHDFGKLLVEGQLKRPEMTVVTGDSGENNTGLLSLREDFLDHEAINLGVEIP